MLVKITKEEKVFVFGNTAAFLFFANLPSFFLFLSSFSFISRSIFLYSYNIILARGNRIRVFLARRNCGLPLSFYFRAVLLKWHVRERETERQRGTAIKRVTEIQPNIVSLITSLVALTIYTEKFRGRNRMSVNFSRHLVHAIYFRSHRTHSTQEEVFYCIAWPTSSCCSTITSCNPLHR